VNNPKQSEIVTVEVGPLAFGGAFVSKIEDSGPEPRKKVFVRHVVTGEKVQAEIRSEHPSYYEAKSLKVLQSSKDRRTPPCEIFGKCGGCDLQHITIQKQRELKRQMVESSLERQAKVAPQDGVILIGKDAAEFFYRKRITLHLNSSGELGFYELGTRDVVDMQRCFLATPAVQAALDQVKPFAKNLGPEVSQVILDQHQNGVDVVLRVREDWHGAAADLARQISRVVPNLQVKRDSKILFAQANHKAIDLNSDQLFPAGHFSQVNQEANLILIEEVLKLIKGRKVLDLYAGSGNFSLPLALQGCEVTAIEIDQALVKHGTSEAKRLGVESNLKFERDAAERYIKSRNNFPTILLDPPRVGAKEVVKHISPEKTAELIYVSCNLPTLGRDLQTLVAKGFKLLEVKVLDMFPQTHHVECLALLRAQP